MPAIGTKVGEGQVRSGTPPVILQLQPTGYIKLEKPEDLRAWEEDVKKFHGISLSANNVVPCETCCGTSSDDCGLV